MDDLPTPILDAASDFIARWKASAAAERANYALFLTQLCDLLGVDEPQPTTDDVEKNAYVFERDVTFLEIDGTTSIGRIDLYKRGCFVLEAKQGSDAQAAHDEEALLGCSAGISGSALARKKGRKKGTAVRGTKAWDDAMIRARGQADRYARALPASEGWPPFLIVVDVGHVIELYSEFTRQGKTYIPFPDPQSFRIKLADLADERVRQRLVAVWTDPLLLDPSKKSAKVTRELAQRLAELAKLLEKANHDPARVARFLMRCLFTMFCEDIKLSLEKDEFTGLLEKLRAAPKNFKPMVEALWQVMNTGGFSTVLEKHISQFNGGLFAEHEALPLSRPMLDVLILAAKADWKDVEPAIFGTLLERALDPIERHKLGAHYTPRAYVERLVMPTIIEPLRDEWNTIYATALTHARTGELREAHDTIRRFHEKLCETRVLDPACGSGNFLYVTLEHMKRLEGEVLNALRELGYEQKILLEIDPHQFLGIELNPRAAAIADLVLWIGYLQWHFRTRGKAQPAEPIIKDYDNIECRDAVLAWDRTEPLLDESGQPVTRWDGRTTKRHPVTGEEVPDETARTVVLQYINPRKAEWPKADYVVGNPPFIGNKRMRLVLGDSYVGALRSRGDGLPETIDFVMYWWDLAACLLEANQIKSFGLITTNSLTQTFNRQIIERHSSQIHLAFAVADHPWVDTEEGASVRIAMTVARSGVGPGLLCRIISETSTTEGHADLGLTTEFGEIHSDLTTGEHTGSTTPLHSNQNLCLQGCKLVGDGFLISPEEFDALVSTAAIAAKFVRSYVTGSDLTKAPKGRFVIDFFGLTAEEARTAFPDGYQIVLTRVKPERDSNRRPVRKKNWWLFGENAPKLRRACENLTRFIATSEVAKHRIFVFCQLPKSLADGSLAAIALDDAKYLGILSSRVHVAWALATGGMLEDRPRYQNGPCFLPFPFPSDSSHADQRIRDLAEQLDGHRKRQQGLHPWLTLTDMYNVLERLRAARLAPASTPGDRRVDAAAKQDDLALTDKERKIHEAGLVSVLKQIHDDLDAAVFAAYGWPANLSDEDILQRLVALNAERAAEEARGLIRWLRPEFQKPATSTRVASERVAAARQKGLDLAGEQAADSRGGGTRSEPRPGKVRRSRALNTGRSTASSHDPRTQRAKLAWPKERAERTKAVQEALAAAGEAVTVAELAGRFQRANKGQIEEILGALVSLGLARRLRSGKFAV